MNVSLFVRRPVTAAVLSLLLTVLGLVSLPRLGVQETPDVSRPVVTVRAIWPGAAPAVMEADVTEVLERELNAIDGLRTISSESQDQLSTITLEFEVDRDLEAAANDARDKVARAQRDLPEGVEAPTVEKADSDGQAVMYLRVVGDRSLLELTELADVLVRERLERIAGVSSVDLYGERRYAMRVELDPVALASRGLALADVEAALRARNVEAPAGRVEGPTTSMALRITEGLDTPEAFAALVVASSDAGVVRLGDVARVRLGAEDERSAARSDGQPSLSLAIQPLSGANIIEISDEVRRRLPDVRRDLPTDVRLEINYDRSIPVRASIEDVLFTLGLSALLVIAVIFAFLRSVRATVVPAVAIVVSLLGTPTVMLATGLTLNVFTLFGLVLAIGLVVDDAIVVLENAWRHLEEGSAPVTAAVEGTKEIVFPVLATTASLAAVFLPVVFAGGTSGRLFFEFGITVATAVILSTVVALTASPALCALLLRRRGEGDPTGTRADRLFGRSVAGVLRQPGLALALVVATVGAGAWLFQTAPREFFPLEDRNFFMVNLTGPEGVSFAWMDARVRELEPVVMGAIPERTGVLSRVGSGRGGTPGAANSARFAIPIVPKAQRERSQAQIVGGVRAALADVTAVRAIPIQFPTVGRGGGSPVQVVLQHDDPEQLAAALPATLERLRDLSGVTDVDVNLKLDRPEVMVGVDRDAAAALGVDVAELARTLQVLSTGVEVDTFRRGSRQYPVMLGLGAEQGQTTDALGQLRVRTRSGALIPLGALVRFDERASASSRYHYDRAPSATFSATPDGVALGEAITRVREAAEGGLSEGFRTALSGPSKDFAESNDTLVLMFVLALVLVYLVLAAQFDSFVDPVPILVSLPVAVAAGLLPLRLLGEPLSFFGQVGLVLLVGLVTKNGILIVEFAGQRLAAGASPAEAALEAAQLRLRPILMTTASTVGGALPVALGASGATRASLGVVVVFGMLASTVLSLYVTPTVWAWLRARTGRPGAGRLQGAAVAGLLAVALPARGAPLTLAEVLDRAEAQAPSLEALRGDARGALLEVEVARMAAVPELTLSGRMQYGNTFVAGGGGVGGDPVGVASFGARLRVPLVAPEAWAGIGAAARLAEVADLRAQAARLDLLRQTAEAWADLQQAAGRLGAATAAGEGSAGLAAVARDREAAGLAIHLEVVRADLQARRDALAVIRAEGEVAVARARLAALVGEGLGDGLPPLDPLDDPGADTGVQGRPDVQAADGQARAVRAQRRATAWALAPTLSAYGDVGVLARLDTPWAPTTAIGLELSWSPVSPVRLATLRRLAVARLAAEVRVDAAVQVAEGELAAARAGLDTAGATLGLAREAGALADEEVALARDRYEAGAGSQVEVLDALRRRAEVGTELADAVAAWDRAVVGLHVATGSLEGLRGRTTP
ncbi:MAG: efflux RND transporter permease subunit [Alphaproteobacteria bacterium]|nr:efflux RND transporter permease subunit [Alphaproteobacteria bacterium]